MLHFIYNPHAGKGLAQRFYAAMRPILEARGVEHSFHETHRRRESVEIARALCESTADELDIVAMGGDGTLNEVLNGLVNPSKVRLGIIPCGSGNDFASAVGIPLTPEGALDVILNGRARYTDYMECSGVRGINAIGTGIDVDILRRYARMKLLKGSAAYMASFILNLFTFKARDFQELVDGRRIHHNALIACAANGQTFGGGIPICPHASVDDGLLDIMIVDDIPRVAYPNAFMKLLDRRILEIPTALYARRDALCVQSDAPMPIQIDGEIYEDLPFNVQLIHGKLRFYRP